MKNNKYIEHHGVKGMKWGVRKDRKLSDNTRVKKSRQSAKKNVRLLSNNDLDSMINRLEKEKKLRTLIDNESVSGRTAQFIKNTVSSSGKRAITTAASGAAVYAVKYALTREFSPKDAASYLAPRPKR